eukprot:1534467-Prymnesium_polylepis.2
MALRRQRATPSWLGCISSSSIPYIALAASSLTSDAFLLGQSPLTALRWLLRRTLSASATSAHAAASEGSNKSSAPFTSTLTAHLMWQAASVAGAGSADDISPTSAACASSGASSGCVVSVNDLSGLRIPSCSAHTAGSAESELLVCTCPGTGVRGLSSGTGDPGGEPSANPDCALLLNATAGLQETRERIMVDNFWPEPRMAPCVPLPSAPPITVMRLPTARAAASAACVTG